MAFSFEHTSFRNYSLDRVLLQICIFLKRVNGVKKIAPRVRGDFFNINGDIQRTKTLYVRKFARN